MMKLKLALIIAVGGLLVAIGLALQASAEPTYSVTPVTYSKVVPDRGTTLNGGTFTAGATNTQGQIITNSSGNLYMVLVAGTNGAAAPTHAHGTATNGSSTYYRVVESKRRGVILSNAGADRIALGIGYAPASTNEGIILDGGGSITFGPEIQDAIYAGTNSLMAIQEY